MHTMTRRGAPIILGGMVLAACQCTPTKIQSGGGVPTGVVTPNQPDGKTLDFGKVQVNRKRTVGFELKNDGLSPLKISDITVAAGTPANFDVKLAAPITIEPGNIGKVPMSFTPTDIQGYVGDVTLVTN